MVLIHDYRWGDIKAALITGIDAEVEGDRSQSSQCVVDDD